MGLWDTISGAWDSIGGWNTVGNIANVAGTAYDIYSGIQSQNQANKVADAQLQLAFGTAAKQDAYAQEAWDRQQEKYWPLEDLNIQYEMEDLKALRDPYKRQVEYQGQRLDEQREQAETLNPIIDDTEISMIRKLVEGEDVLAERYMNQATADIGIAYGAQREQDMRSMGIAGINPNSGQMSSYMNSMGTSQALAEASGRTLAARNAEETALSRNASALNYAKGAQLPNYAYEQSVNSGTVLGGLQGAAAQGSSLGGIANMYNTNAQNSWNGAAYMLNQLSTGTVNPGYRN